MMIFAQQVTEGQLIRRMRGSKAKSSIRAGYWQGIAHERKRISAAAPGMFFFLFFIFGAGHFHAQHVQQDLRA